MSSRLIARTSPLIILIVLALSSLQPLAADNMLTTTPVIRQKASPVLSAQARQFLESRNDQIARVWVFFTDKQVGSKGGFSTLASSVSFSEKVAARRARVGMNDVVFADLPIATEYVNQLVNLGASHRRSSRWLNAASFDIPADLLPRAEALPFVASIRPVARFKNSELTEPAATGPTTTPMKLAPDALNYGSSAGQLEQINVPAVHGKGYDGEGVTLAIFDTGFRKAHDAFARHYLEGRVLDEWDFIFDDGDVSNESEDVSNQWNHGTSTWSVAGGFLDGTIYGPAYRANFLLAKTEDMAGEYPGEEDNWVAAMEWADSLGADVTTSSLGYSDWYTYEDFDGQTAVITLAANTADGLGIVTLNSMGNEGPAAGSLTAPADAFNILACGAVTSSGGIASFSGRGPTYDGRTKPEVCAQGVNVYCAWASTTSYYGTSNGTSFSTPLVAGAATVLIQARPNYTPEMIRRALMETADNAETPNDTYGWGIINLDAALEWGANFQSDVTSGPAPLTASFSDESAVTPTSWLWDFGDGNTSVEQSPTHVFENPGIYDVSLTIGSEYGDLTTIKEGYVLALGDTLRFGIDSTYAGQEVVSHVYLTNSQPINEIYIPFYAEDAPIDVSWDSVSLGERTQYFDRMQFIYYSPANNRFCVRLVADYDGDGTPLLAPGTGEVLKVYWSTDPWAVSGLSNTVDTSAATTQDIEMTSDRITYVPEIFAGQMRIITVLRGDVNHDQSRNLADISELLAYIYLNGDPPVSLPTADLNADGKINLADASFLISYVYLNGRDPVSP